jgi:hypothetical protein
MRILLLSLLIIFCTCCYASDSSFHYIKINFLYGSKPAKGYKDTEAKLFGGLKGGHVNIEAGGRVLDFLPGNNPILPNNKKPTGGYRINHSAYKNREKDKWTTVVVPVSEEQFTRLQKLFDSLSSKTPYDYSVFGMRCAAASYDVLSEIGLFKKVSIKQNVTLHFYPKLLRKKLIKWAEKNNYTILKHEGSPSRKWESDKGLL